MQRSSPHFDPMEDADLLKASLRKTPRLADLFIRYSTDDDLELRIPIPPEEQFILPELKTIYTARHVSPQELLKCLPELEKAEFNRKFSEDEALETIAVLQRGHVDNLTISVKELSPRFLEGIATLTNLVHLDIGTLTPHRDPWTSSSGDVSPRVLGVSDLQFCRSSDI